MTRPAGGFAIPLAGPLSAGRIVMGKELEESTIKHARPSVYLFRAGPAHLRSVINHHTPEVCARELYGHDPVTAIVLRASSSPATIGSSTWAGALAATSVDDTVMAISSLSAAAGLIQRGLKVDLGNF